MRRTGSTPPARTDSGAIASAVINGVGNRGNGNGWGRGGRGGQAGSGSGSENPYSR